MPFHRPTVSESRIKRITQITRITPHPYRRFIVPIRCVLHIRPEKGENGERFCEGMDEGFLIALCPIGTYPLTPLPTKKGER